MLDVRVELDDIASIEGQTHARPEQTNMKTNGHIRIERMSNGMIRAFDWKSGTYGLYELDGTPRSGDLARALPDLIRSTLD